MLYSPRHDIHVFYIPRSTSNVDTLHTGMHYQSPLTWERNARGSTRGTGSPATLPFRLKRMPESEISGTSRSPFLWRRALFRSWPHSRASAPPPPVVCLSILAAVETGQLSLSSEADRVVSSGCMCTRTTHAGTSNKGSHPNSGASASSSGRSSPSAPQAQLDLRCCRHAFFSGSPSGGGDV